MSHIDPYIQAADFMSHLMDVQRAVVKVVGKRFNNISKEEMMELSQDVLKEYIRIRDKKPFHSSLDQEPA